MSNDYYVSTGTPATGSFGASAPMRSQFNLIEDAFDKLPTLSGNDGKLVMVNSSGTGLTVSSASFSLGGDFATTGAFSTTLAQVANVVLTLPGSNATLATLSLAETLSNKVLANASGSNPSLTVGSAATLTTPRAIYGNDFNGSAALTQIIASTFGGTGNGFTKFSGATSSEKTYTLPDASTTIITTGATSNVTVGYTYTSFNAGTKSSGTFTPDPANGNAQYATNNGAHTLAAPSSDCSITLLYTNGASAGAITFSGFTVGTSTGDALTTTNTSKFVISIVRINSVSTYLIKALQA